MSPVGRPIGGRVEGRVESQGEGGVGRTIAGIVLAAGRSSRMGEAHNKLVELVGDRPLVAAPVDALIGAGVEPILVVTGFEAERVHAALGARRCRFVHHDAWPEGMGRSLAQGALALVSLAPGAEAVVVCVGDLPALTADHVGRVVAAARTPAGTIDPAALVVPTCRGRRGHPVLFGADHFEALARLEGDRGGRSILEANAARTSFVEIDDDGILVDVDTPAELALARTRAERPGDAARAVRHPDCGDSRGEGDEVEQGDEDRRRA